ncbi:MAG: hypothetical protein IMW90_08660 [Thermogemmatispora sp.]|jgi:hypothetical protein|nr:MULTISPECIES: hypothetical protein [Thermogemmatispora]MBE3565783.1 hypothetical protein [Thermogemmatispora sp.]GER82328.1 hypothetical protein KTAU_09660 [Thermogemmatispora aurantia]
MMNPRIDEERQPETPCDTTLSQLTDEGEVLMRQGFTEDEVTSLLWLRQWYQSGGSDRMEIVRRLEFIRMLFLQGKIEL